MLINMLDAFKSQIFSQNVLNVFLLSYRCLCTYCFEYVVYISRRKDPLNRGSAAVEVRANIFPGFLCMCWNVYID